MHTKVVGLYASAVEVHIIIGSVKETETVEQVAEDASKPDTLAIARLSSAAMAYVCMCISKSVLFLSNSAYMYWS